MTQAEKTIKGLIDFEDLHALSKENAVGVLETIKGTLEYVTEDKADYTILTIEQRTEIRESLLKLLEVLIEVNPKCAAQAFVAHQAAVGEQYNDFKGKMEYIADQLKIAIEKRPKTFVDRLQIETRELVGRKLKLEAFLGSEEFPLLPRDKKTLLYKQERLMSELLETLGHRMELEGKTYKVETVKENTPT